MGDEDVILEADPEPAGHDQHRLAGKAHAGPRVDAASSTLVKFYDVIDAVFSKK